MSHFVDKIIKEITISLVYLCLETGSYIMWFTAIFTET
jgi:hypothetical protein